MPAIIQTLFADASAVLFGAAPAWRAILEIVIAACCVIMGCELAYLLRRRPDWAFRGLSAVCALFLLALGATILVRASQATRAEGPAAVALAVAAAALGAILTAAVIRLAPSMTRLPSRAQLRGVNEGLRRRAEEFNRAERRFRVLLESAPDAMVVIGVEGVIQVVNGRAESLLGKTRDDLVGSSIQTVLRDAEIGPALECLKRLGGAGAEDAPHASETELRGAGGRLVPVEIRVSLFEEEPKGYICAIRDVTESRRAREELLRASAELERRVEERTAELRESEQFLESALNSLSERIAIIDGEGKILAVNTAWREGGPDPEFLGVGCGVGDNYLESFGPDTGFMRRDMVASVLSGIRDVLMSKRSEFAIDYPYHDSARKRWFTLRVRRFQGAGGARVVLSHENITGRKLAEEQLRHYASHDPLTGLSNRTVFAAALDRALSESIWKPDFLFGTLFVDLDGFKPVNDRFGHLVGDQLLVAVARRVKACLREGDAVARIGGDEFTALLNGLTSPAEAEAVRDRILTELCQPYRIGPHEVFITASAGLALSTDRRFRNGDEILSAADEAMYAAKRAVH